jgi:phosphate transport system substrate-binding protein
VNKRFALAALSAALLLTACGGAGATNAPATPIATSGSSAAPATSGATSGAPAGIEGNVDIHGSSTVAPISNAVAEDVSATNPEFSFFVGDEGTGAGFSEFFCVGNSDISDASRKIRADDPAKEGDEESTVCANNGVDYV